MPGPSPQSTKRIQTQESTAAPKYLAADCALLVVYGAVAAFFFSRYLRHHRLPSIGVALLSLGWILFAATDLGLFDTALERWVGVPTGIFLLSTAWWLDTKDRRK